MILIYLLLLLLILLFLIRDKREDFKNKNKLTIIVPIRNREKQLKKLLENYQSLFKNKNIDYRIYIIEQTQGKTFNKGKINNVGFKISELENKHTQNYLFNDVDNYPLSKNTYNYNVNSEGIHHLFGHRHCLGGILIMNKNIFKKINGYPNDFWGWGGEDVDLKKRAENLGVKIIRKQFIDRSDNKRLKLVEDDITQGKQTHISIRPNEKKKKINMKKYKENPKSIFDNGITNCNYKILKKKIVSPNVYRFLVDI